MGEEMGGRERYLCPSRMNDSSPLPRPVELALPPVRPLVLIMLQSCRLFHCNYDSGSGYMRTQRDDMLTPVLRYKSQKSPESVMRMKEREIAKEQTDDKVDLVWHMNWCISMYTIPCA